MLSNLPRQKLGFFPTPLTELKNLTKELLGPRIFIKRDDQTGLAIGGNKTRKLEYLIGDAISKNCDTIITGGAAQSNHCRQTAAACAYMGLGCSLVLGGESPKLPSGNLLLNNLLGANIIWSKENRKGENIPEIVEELKSEGRKPYLIPYGGSNEIGACSFVQAYSELKTQLKNINLSSIVFASSSGGTQAGLMLGKEICSDKINIIGINIDKGINGEKSFKESVLDLTNKTSKKLEISKEFNINDIILRDEFTGEGYGVVGDSEREAIQLLARTEGILLDPVYTGRAMAGLIAMIRNKEFSKDENVVFWHTGGTPALFHYAKDLI